MKKNLIIFSLILLAGFAGLADTFSVNGSTKLSSLNSPNRIWATNTTYFTYYGFSTTNPFSGFVASTGISSKSELGKFPPVQVMFDVTGTSFELVLDSYDYVNDEQGIGYYTLSDGITTTSYTNSTYTGIAGYSPSYTLVTFASNGVHHMTLALKGNFAGVNVTVGNTVSQRVLSPKPNLLIVEGDSYTEGYNPSVSVFSGFQSFWFDGWVWQLAQLAPNTIAVPCGISGTGFIAGSPGANYVLA
ncbi:MAG: hypothetical protein WDN00_08575 [Limisphaerales bacterium]